MVKDFSVRWISNAKNGSCLFPHPKNAQNNKSSEVLRIHEELFKNSQGGEIDNYHKNWVWLMRENTVYAWSLYSRLWRLQKFSHFAAKLHELYYIMWTKIAQNQKSWRILLEPSGWENRQLPEEFSVKFPGIFANNFQLKRIPLYSIPHRHALRYYYTGHRTDWDVESGRAVQSSHT